MTKIKFPFPCMFLIAFVFSGTFALAHDPMDLQGPLDLELIAEQAEDDLELMPDFFSFRACKKANASQLVLVNNGNAQRSAFMTACLDQTGSQKWCDQIERPNPSSKSIFSCTYGASQVHQLIHPARETWKNAFKAIELIQRLSKAGICVSQIYNWWRPEPYNANVGGAAGRHPYGTSVDVRFCSSAQAVKAFDLLCTYRKKGEVRALGYYGNSGVHFGIADSSGNTWGRGCK
jgi:hypothetical protein